MDIIDLHNDVLLELNDKAFLRYVLRIKKQGVRAIFLSVWTTESRDPIKDITRAKVLIERLKNGGFLWGFQGGYLHIEDAWFLTPENIDLTLSMRPFSVGLTWNANNTIAGGSGGNGDLTPFGAMCIEKFVNAGVKIDLAHLNRKSFFSVAKMLGNTPLLCTHTAFDAVNKHARNLTDLQVETIVKSGGLIGLCLVKKFIGKSVYDHILYFIKKWGSDNLALGTDFYGTRDLPKGLKNYRQLKNLEKGLRKRGISDEVIKKIFYENAMRFCGIS